jgi:tetratricopeptide (TPR) repeat protein
MDIKAIVTNPLVVTAIGALAGYMLKASSDLWTNEVKRRQEFASHFVAQIEAIAPTYYLMANYAYLLSFSLNGYLEAKRELQLLPLGVRLSLYDDLQNVADQTAKEALFYACRLYREMNDSFWVKGGRYLMPDRWANKAIEDLHNKLVATFQFNSDVLFRYIKSDTELVDFKDALNKAKKDLREEYNAYCQWLLTQERQVIQAAVQAQAYANLFGQQMDRLYKDYYHKETVWGVAAKDAAVSPETLNKTADLFEETRKCITRAAQDRRDRETKRSEFFVSEIEPDDDSLIGEAAFNLGWNLYTQEKFELATIAYQQALQKLGPEASLKAAVHNNLGNVYTSQKKYQEAAVEYQAAITLKPGRSMFHKNLGLMYYQSGAYDSAVRCLLQSVELEPEDQDKQYLYNDLGNALLRLNDDRRKDAIQYYRRAIALNPFEPVYHDNLAAAYEREEEYDLAIEVCETSVKLATGAPAAPYYSRMGRLYGLLNPPNWDGAIEAYTNAAKSDPKLTYVGAMVEAYKKAGRLRDLPGNQAADAGKKATPAKISEIRLKAELYQALGEEETAAGIYEDWIRHSQWNKLLELGVRLEYKMAVNQVDRYTMAIRTDSTVVQLGGRQQENQINFTGKYEQKALAVNPDGTYEIAFSMEGEPDPPHKEMSAVMSKNGTILQTTPPGLPPFVVPFPDKELHRGETWRESLPLPVSIGEEGELQLVHKLADIGVRKGRICAYIVDSCFSETKTETGKQQITAAGEKWFDFANGVLVESHVESRVVVNDSDDSVVLTTTKIDVELAEDKDEKAAAGKSSEPQQTAQG